MKKVFAGICVVSLIGLSDMQAQHESIVWKNDPTYSVYNYKHPNKAAAAKKLQYIKGIQLVSVHEPSRAGQQTKVMILNRRIVATEKTSNGKVKTPLAIRRKTSEKGSEQDN
jgi:hypothetical protein